MVRFFITENDEIEIDSYDAGTTLADLAAELEAFRETAPHLKTGKCKGCGECCSDNIPVLGLDFAVLGIDPGALVSGPAALGPGPGHASGNIVVLPDKPDMGFRRKAIREMCEWTSISELEATLLFEYNNAEPLTLARQASGACCFLRDGLCSRHTRRPQLRSTCATWETAAYIQEMIVRQGTWHAYYKLGWISGEASHNPFLRADCTISCWQLILIRSRKHVGAAFLLFLMIFPLVF